MDIAGIKPKKSIVTIIKEKVYKLKKKFINIFCKNKKEKLERLTTFRNVISEDLKDYFKNVNSEVLLIWGAKDIDTPIKDAYYINKKIKNSHLIIFPYGSHFTYLEYSDNINLIIVNFIK